MLLKITERFIFYKSANILVEVLTSVFITVYGKF